MEQLQNKSGRQPQQRKTVDINFGKIPPQARELEEAILGAVMLEKRAFDAVSEILGYECFYVDAHQRIFKGFQALSRKNMPIDILTVAEQLKSTEELDMVGGPYYITRLTNAVVSSANIEAHSRIVLQKFIQRELIRISGEIITDAYEDSADCFALLDYSEKQINSLNLSTSKQGYYKVSKPVSEVIERVTMLKNRPVQSNITGVPTGIKRLDDITSGWQPMDFIILAARPSVGKSAIAANLCINAASHAETPVSVGVFSLEMSAAQWASRFLSAETKIDAWKLTKGAVTDDELSLLTNVGYEQISNLGIFIDDTSAIDVYQLKAKARRMVFQDKVGMIIIDYLQLMSGLRGKNDNREQEISTISRNLKALAKELKVPVIALSQLSRGVEKVNREPMLSDLRESGAIEQDADMVIFLTAPDEVDIQKDPDNLRDSILMKIAKHRNGPLDKISVRFVKEIQKVFSNDDYDRYMTLRRAGLGGRWIAVNPIMDQNNNNLQEEQLPF